MLKRRIILNEDMSFHSIQSINYFHSVDGVNIEKEQEIKLINDFQVQGQDELGRDTLVPIKKKALVYDLEDIYNYTQMYYNDLEEFLSHRVEDGEIVSNYNGGKNTFVIGGVIKKG